MWCTTESIRVGAHQLLVLINKWYYPETNTKHAFVEQLCDFLGSSLTFVERSVVYGSPGVRRFLPCQGSEFEVQHPVLFVSLFNVCR